MGYFFFIVALNVDSSCDNTFDYNSKAINSPNYPREYPKTKHCTWNVTAPIGSTIIVERFYYSIENSSNCGFDRLKLYDGSSNHSVVDLCGESSFGGMTSTANNLYFEFHSDGSNSFKGFQITFSIVGMKWMI